MCRINSWILMFFFGSLLSLTAQEEAERLTRELTLEREYAPTVQDANKVSRLPELTPPKVIKRAIDYASWTIPVEPEKELSLLSPGTMMTAIPYNKRRGYLHLGGGMYNNLDGDFGYHILNNGVDKLNIFLSHRSMRGDIKDLPSNSKRLAILNDNLGGIHFSHLFKQNARLRLGGEYGLTLFNYYGTPFRSFCLTMLESSLIDKQSLQQNQSAEVYLGISSKEKASFGYLFDISYRAFFEKYAWENIGNGLKEHHFTLLTGLSHTFDDGARTIGIRGDVDYLQWALRDTLNHFSPKEKTNHISFKASPYYQMKGERWQLQAGAHVIALFGEEDYFMVTPNVRFDAQVADKTTAYAVAGGELKHNDGFTIARINRYMDHSFRLTPSRTWLDLEGGIRSSLLPGLTMGLSAGYKYTVNDVFFVPLIFPRSYFDVNYISAIQPNSGKVSMGGMLKYQYRKLFDVALSGNYYVWKLTGMVPIHLNLEKMNQEKIFSTQPYGRPSVELEGEVNVRPFRGLTFTLHYYGGLGRPRYCKVHREGSELNMPNMHALNFKTTYCLNDTFGAYFKLNNLLFQHYEIYEGYALQGFHILAGVNINF